MKTKDITLISAFIALIAVCSWISVIGLTPVQFTMQTFAVFLAAGLLGGKKASVSVLLYILLGLVGAPVFSGFRGGISVLFDRTGGYILGFLAIPLAVWLFERLFDNRKWAIVVGMVLGLLICYAFGTLFFLRIYAQQGSSITVGAVLTICVFPFLIPDALKLLLAVTLTAALKDRIKF